MNKFILFLTLFASTGPVLVTFTYTGATGNWTDGTKWTGGVSPLTGSTSTGVTFGSVATVSLNNNATVNNLKFTSTATLNTSTANTITLDGTSAFIRSNAANVVGTITCPMVIAADLSLVSSGSGSALVFGTGITATSRNISMTSTVANSTSGNVRFNTTGNTGMTGGTFTVSSGYLNITNTGLGGAAGPTLIEKNDGVIDAVIQVTTGTVANNITFSDVGTRIFSLSSVTGTDTFSGTVTGAITHDLAFSGVLTGNWSGFSTSANIFPTVASINTSTFPTNKITIGYLNNPFSLSTNQSLTNNIDFALPSSVSTTTGISQTGTSTTLSGNYVIDKNAVAPSGSQVDFSCNASNPCTWSGVISNLGTAANTTVIINGSQTARFTGTNTYTNPTTAANAELQVNGSITSNVTITSNGGRLSGKGSVGAITCSTGTSSIHAYSKDNSPSVTDVLTANGNVTFTSTTSKFDVFTSTTASSKLAVNGNVTFSAGAAVVIATGSTALTSGNSAVIMTYTGTSSGTLTPPAGYTISDVAGVITLTKT